MLYNVHKSAFNFSIEARNVILRCSIFNICTMNLPESKNTFFVSKATTIAAASSFERRHGIKLDQNVKFDREFEAKLDHARPVSQDTTNFIFNLLTQVVPKSSLKIKMANAIFWIYLGGTA